MNSVKIQYLVGVVVLVLAMLAAGTFLDYQDKVLRASRKCDCEAEIYQERIHWTQKVALERELRAHAERREKLLEASFYRNKEMCKEWF